MMQRLIQLIVLVAMVVVIAKPQLVPPPVRMWAEAAHVWVVGETDSWQSFQNVWRERLLWLGSLIPWFKTLATTIPPEPPQITADSILYILRQIVIARPMEKWEMIKKDIGMPVENATPGAIMAPEQ